MLEHSPQQLLLRLLIWWLLHMRISQLADRPLSNLSLLQDRYCKKK